jgi:hypothetical protein
MVIFFGRVILDKRAFLRVFLKGVAEFVPKIGGNYVAISGR